MSTPGLSLVGFMTDQQKAFQYLRTQRVRSDPSDAALLKEWNAAKAKRGAPMPNAGKPDVLPIPANSNCIYHAIATASMGQEAFRKFGYTGVELKLIEIDPLFAIR